MGFCWTDGHRARQNVARRDDCCSSWFARSNSSFETMARKASSMRTSKASSFLLVAHTNMPDAALIEAGAHVRCPVADLRVSERPPKDSSRAAFVRSSMR